MSQETPRYDYQMPSSLSGEDHFWGEGGGGGGGDAAGPEQIVLGNF